MLSLRSICDGLKALLRPAKRNAEIQAEVESFFQAAVDHKTRLGMSKDKAERAARIEISSAEMVRHKIWAGTWEAHAESLWGDVRYGFRQIGRSPALSLVAILSLALGIGANTAIFTVIDDLLLKQLPVRDPSALVSFGEASGSGIVANTNPGPYDIFPYDFYRQIAGEREAFDGICAFASFPAMVSVRTASGAAGSATQAISHLVSGSFFEVLGTHALMGRTLNPDDTAAEGASAVAVISHRYWQEELAADPGVIGRTISINGTLFVIVGVMPQPFFGVDLNEQSPDMWLPITMQPQVMLMPSLLRPGGLLWIHMMARRKPGILLAAEQSWTTIAFQRYLTEREGGNPSAFRRGQIRGTSIPLLPGGAGLSHLRADYETPLKILMIMVGSVLLIACGNLANLLLAKATVREREFCARLALGASRGRIARQILIEAALLALLGGSLGLGVAFCATRAILAFIARGAAHTPLAATPDLRVLAFTFMTCVLTAILFGAAPALRGSRTEISGTLQTHARTTNGVAGSRNGLAKLLLVVQVTLSLVLLTVAGLFLKTLLNLRAQNTGMERSQVLLINTNPKFPGYRPEQLHALYERILSRVSALPGVRRASLAGSPPLLRGNWGSPIGIDGRPFSVNNDFDTLLNRVSANYFETLGIPLLRGRTIEPSDNAQATKAAVVNKIFADRFFAAGDALGHNFTIADPAAPGVWQIVGIVRDAQHAGPADKPQPFAYLAVTQLAGNDQYAYWLQVRGAGDGARLVDEVRHALAEVDPNLPILKVQTIEEQFDGLIDQQRFVSRLAILFALLALLLACIGLYGVMTYSVVRRTSELGLRMALGAGQRTVLWMVVQESLVLLMLGILLGIPASIAAGHMIKSNLFGVAAADWPTMIAASVTVSICFITGALMPAQRAARIDPMVALRYE